MSVQLVVTAVVFSVRVGSTVVCVVDVCSVVTSVVFAVVSFDVGSIEVVTSVVFSVVGGATVVWTVVSGCVVSAFPVHSEATVVM